MINTVPVKKKRRRRKKVPRPLLLSRRLRDLDRKIVFAQESLFATVRAIDRWTAQRVRAKRALERLEATTDVGRRRFVIGGK